MLTMTTMYKLECTTYMDFNPSRFSSPTCEDLGIPNEDIIPTGKYVRNPSLHLEGLRYEAVSKSDPFSPFCIIPLPSQFGAEHIEPAFIRKRNERERERVRCVNDGYNRLKEHLPLEKKDKRISKVETLRCAIDYIKYLESLLENASDDEDEDFKDRDCCSGRDSEKKRVKCKRKLSDKTEDSSPVDFHKMNELTDRIDKHVDNFSGSEVDSIVEEPMVKRRCILYIKTEIDT